MADAEVEGDVPERVDDGDQRDRHQKPRLAVGEVPVARSERDRNEEERREAPREEDRLSQPYSALKYATP